MHFDWWTFALQTINFAILVWLLHRFLYKPVLRLIDVRRKEIEKQFADAKAVEETAKAHLAEIESQRAGIAAERDRMIKAAAQQADEIAQAKQAQAAKEAAALLEDARRVLAKERAEASVEARQAALDLAADMARKLIAQMPMERRSEAWLDQVEHYLAQLPADERSALAAQLKNSSAITLVSAAALSGAVEKEWQGRLSRALSANVVLDFAVDAGLIAGVELHFPQSILRFSLQSALTSLRSEIEKHGNTCR